ncbi:MAG: hypothetical protein MHM6MM_000991 [Cercozoa sp. M6MM]
MVTLKQVLLHGYKQLGFVMAVTGVYAIWDMIRRGDREADRYWRRYDMGVHAKNNTGKRLRDKALDVAEFDPVIRAFLFEQVYQKVQSGEYTMEHAESLIKDYIARMRAVPGGYPRLYDAKLPEDLLE